MEPKERKGKKKHDPPREHNGKDAPPDETTDLAPEQPRKEASRVNGSPKGHKRSENSGDDPQSETQPPTEGIPETLTDKKAGKRKKEKGERTRLKQAADVSIAPLEPLAASVDGSSKDEKKVKKRKKHEKKEEDAEANHDGTGGDAATKLEPLAPRMDDAKVERKKRKGKEEKATGEKRKHEDAVANDVEKKRRKHR
jgi:hypothetical protein